MSSRLFLATICLAAAAIACPTQESVAPAPDPTGAPEVSVEQVEEHAAQFDAEVPERAPGSDEEFAAASYLLGHLQLAGYGTFLDAVPVQDLIRSTNVVAFPPSGDDPEKLIVVEYGTAKGGPDRGIELGLFLEVARALRIAEPDHAVGFVALGAATEQEEASLGAERLAAFLDERDLEPTIVEFWDVPNAEVTFKAYGDPTGLLNDIANRLDPDCGGRNACAMTDETVRLPDHDLWEQEDLTQTVITGQPEEIGAVLLKWLSA